MEAGKIVHQQTDNRLGTPMKRIVHTALAASFLLSSFATAMAQPYQQDQRHDEPRHEEQRRPEQRAPEQRAPERHYQEVQRHGGYRQGEAMHREDWDRGRRLDYREYGLREPPYGYEWRDVGGVFILGAIATGIIATIMMAPQ